MSDPEAVVAQFSELHNGEKRQVRVGETDVLLMPIGYWNLQKLPIEQ
mgnify:CR=1 FL=1